MKTSKVDQLVEELEAASTSLRRAMELLVGHNEMSIIQKNTAEASRLVHEIRIRVGQMNPRED